MTDDSKSARELVAKLFRSVDSSAGRQYVALHQNWQSLVGIDLAAHSEPVDIRRDALVVELDHPGWMQMLQMQERRLVQRLRRDFPELAIKTLQMRLKNEPDAREQAVEQPVEQTPEQTPEQAAKQAGEAKREPERSKKREQPEHSEGLDRIDDPELRERLERLGKMIAERNAEERNAEEGNAEERKRHERNRGENRGR